MSGELRRMAQRLAGLVTRGLVGHSEEQEAGQAVQMETAYGRREELRSQPFGLSSRPLPGAEAVILQAGPDSQIIIQVGAREYEIRTLSEGEVAVHDAYGHQVRLLETGIVVVVGTHQLDIQRLATAPDGATFGGLVHGGGIDPYTGQSYAVLGATTRQIRAEKT